MSQISQKYKLNLSQEEKDAIHQSWAPVTVDMKKSGVEFFIYLFGAYPDTKLVFQHFAKVPLDELAQSKRFQAHAYTVMTTLTNYVKNMDDPDLNSTMLFKTGENHVVRISVDMFKVVKPGVLGFLEHKMKDKFTAVTRSGWDKLLDAIVDTAVEGYEFEKQKHQ